MLLCRLLLLDLFPEPLPRFLLCRPSCRLRHLPCRLPCRLPCCPCRWPWRPLRQCQCSNLLGAQRDGGLPSLHPCRAPSRLCPRLCRCSRSPAVLVAGYSSLWRAWHCGYCRQHATRRARRHLQEPSEKGNAGPLRSRKARWEPTLLKPSRRRLAFRLRGKVAGVSQLLALASKPRRMESVDKSADPAVS